MIKRNSLYALLLSCFIYCQISVAAITLFDPNRGQALSQPPSAIAKPIQKKISIIYYRLVGISSLSSIYHLTFQEIRDKKFKTFIWQKDKKISDSPVDGFHIKAVESRRVILQTNQGHQYGCKDTDVNKITCLPDKNLIIFDLVTNIPTQPVKNPLSKAMLNKQKKTSNKNPFKNPFKLK